MVVRTFKAPLVSLLFTALFVYFTEAQAPVRLTSTQGTSPSSNNAGRLEIFLNGQWGTVCDDGFGLDEATVACRQLGFDGYTAYGSVDQFRYMYSVQPLVSTPILLDDVTCTLTDPGLESCSHRGIGVHNCAHNEDVALVCYKSGSLRLDSSTSSFSSNIYRTNAGRLEIYINSEWGTVCDDAFDLTDATVACRQLGYSGVTSESNGFGNVGRLGYTVASFNVPIWRDEVACSPSHTTLEECPFDAVTSDCGHSEDVALVCTSLETVATPRPTVPSSAAPLRLTSNLGTFHNANNAGRLEIFLNDQWGTVCDDSFGSSDATVACRQLGYDGYIFYGTVGNIGYVPATISVPIWLDDLGCTSSDTALESCSHNGIGVENCGHSEDVALSCYQRRSLRLVSSSSNYDTSSGRLEIYLNGQWGTVCTRANSFGPTDANVACRQLGYTGEESHGNVLQLGYNGAAVNVPIWLSDVDCSISDTPHLEDCPYTSNTDACDHFEDVALSCVRSTGSSGGGGGSSSGSVIGIVVGVLAFAVPIGIVVVVVIACSCFTGSAGRGYRRHTTPNVVATNVQPAASTTVIAATSQTAQTSTLPAQEPYPAAYPTTPQQPPAPFAPQPDSVLYPQQPPAPPYPGVQQFSPYPQQPPQAYYPETTTETGTAPYPTNVDPAYPPPTNPGYPQAGGYPQAADGGYSGYIPSTDPSYPQAGGGPGYPLTAGEPSSYPPQ